MVDAPEPEVVVRLGVVGIKGVIDREDLVPLSAERYDGPGDSEIAGGGLTGEVGTWTRISDR